ncbi:MAG: type II toxin-antitoxin system VapC family toxin [Acidobacteria bacterium]|nr:type II toxin-antitoxin system VapC family toxin [Acidobacteriota bacterium]
MENPDWVYFDTSLFVKLFVRETGTAEAIDWARGRRIFSSAILLTECFSALARKREEGVLSPKSYRELADRIREGARSVEIVQVVSEILQASEEIALGGSARAVDALHIASALAIQRRISSTLPFLTADRRQAGAARASGLDARLIP